MTALRRQQPRQRGRGGPRVHVTKAIPPASFPAPPAPRANSGRPAPQVVSQEGGQRAVPRKAPCPTPLPSPSRGPVGGSEGGGSGFQVLRFGAAAETRYPRPPTQASHPQRGLRHTCKGSATAPSQRRFQAPPSVTPRRPGRSRVLSRPGA